MLVEEKVKKHNAFMGTIAVSIVYAVVALLLLLVGYFTDYGKRSVLGSISTFTTTFIIGTILVIVLMTFLVVSWQPEEATKKRFNNGIDLNTSSCPDYWNVDIVDDGNDKSTLYTIEKDEANGVERIKQGENEVLRLTSTSSSDKRAKFDQFKQMIENLPTDKFKRVCKYDSNISNEKVENIPQANDMDIPFRFLIEEENTDNIDCSKVYPEYLGQLDATEYANNNYTGNPNRLRCEYAKACGVPWTEAGCN